MRLSASDPVFLRLDQEAPSLAFEPQSEADPLRVAVRVADRHSGVDTGEIEIRQRGGNVWHSLAAAREGQALVAYVDDERFRSGAYEFRAVFGTEPATRRPPIGRTTGARATIDLPARFATGLTVGHRRVMRRKKRRIVRLLRSATARHNSRLTLRGRLTNSDGQPLDGATVQVVVGLPGRCSGTRPGRVRPHRPTGPVHIRRACHPQSGPSVPVRRVATHPFSDRGLRAARACDQLHPRPSAATPKR